jgi:hypothetical protein
MNEYDNNFEALSRLLALKRHEIPPPGYFEDFSGSVIGRIRAGQAVQKLPWMLRFLQAFEARPAYPVAFASTLCVLLLFGIVSVEQNPEIAIQPAFENSSPVAFATPNQGTSSSQPMLAFGGTNSPIDMSLFSSPTTLQPQVQLSQSGN